MEWLLELDTEWFYLINQSGRESWDSFMLFTTHKLSWIPLYLLLVILIIREKKKDSIWIFAAIGFVILLCDMGSVHLFKNNFERLRPCHALENIRLVTDGCGGQFGFISSHASNVFGLAIVIGKLLEKKSVFLLLFLWAVLVSYSRVYVGVHYPFDIIGGILWGTFVALLTVKLHAYLTKK